MKTKRICFVTATRAEYGQIAPVMRSLKGKENVTLQILVTGTHLVESYGYTYKEIEKDGFNIDERVEIQLNTDTRVGICKTMGLAMIGISEALNRLSPDMIVILGDRYEMLSVASVATVMDIPIAHISGGDSTPYAMDDSIRHAITKMSTLHFAFTDQYRNRIIQMGENPERVFNVGALGVENAKLICCMSKEEITQKIGFNINRKYILFTYHPTTGLPGKAQEDIDNILSAFATQDEYSYIFTKANSDPEGEIINLAIEKFVKERMEKAILVDSLGTELYLNVMRYADIVMGNSSSIIVEAPTFKIPIINIGERQLGRLKSQSIVNCKALKDDVSEAMNYIKTKEYLELLHNSKNPFEGNNTSKSIVEKIEYFLEKDNKSKRKVFYDYEE